MLDGAIACAIAAVVELVTSEDRQRRNQGKLARLEGERVDMLAVRIDCGDRSRKGTRHHLRQHVNPQGSLDHSRLRGGAGLPRTDPLARHVHR